MKITPAIVSVLLLMGCTQNPAPDAQTVQSQDALPAPVGNIDRVSVMRINVFRDDLSYNGVRGVYLIKDKDTSKEFIGISGIGITEVGSHMNGKIQTQDER